MASVLQYGGVQLEVQKQLSWTRQAIYDGPVFLYQRHVLHVRCYYNPQATAFSSPTTQRFGTLAPTTDVAIRQTLLQPQQELTYTIGSVVALQSPMAIDANTVYETDANNGPLPLHCDVVEVLGIKTFIVDFIIQTDINECTSGHIVLSNRWEMTHDINEDHLTTRVIRGHAILRTDLMLNDAVVPDDFRAAFFFPVDTNMQREHIHVVATEDGNEVDYQVEDTERFFNLQGYPVGLTRIEAFHTAEIGKPGIDDIIIGVARPVARGLGRAGAIAGHGYVQAGLSSGTNAIGVAAGLGLSALGTAIDVGIAVAQLVPRQVDTVVARVWGNRNSTRKDLESIALTICLNRVGNAIVLGTCWFQVTHDLMGKYVECQIRTKRSIIDTITQNAQQTDGFISGVVQALTTLNTNIMPVRELIPGLTTQAFAANPAPPAATTGVGFPTITHTSRGTYIGRLVAQALQDPCALPANPVNSVTPVTSLDMALT